MKNILITGANGQIGRELHHFAPQYSGFNFVWTDYEELDITSQEQVLQFFQDKQIDACINCAAYTAVDKAESNQETAHKVNVLGAQYLAEACAVKQLPLFHYSTDYVYHSQQNTPFKETDETAPKSVYASTKLEGEKAALAANPNTMVIRTSWVYSSFGHNFIKTMLRLGKDRDQLNVVFDQVGAPTYARDIAAATLNILDRLAKGDLEATAIQGIFHYSNEGVTSWYDFALAIFEIAGLSCQVNPIESKDYPTPAQRPPFSVLNKEKIKETFGIQIPHWRTSAKACIEILVEQQTPAQV